MGKRSQLDRRLQLATPLGDDVLLLKSMHGVERLGALFEYNLELLSEDHEIKFADIVGQNVTIRLDMAEREPRYINGYVSQFGQIGSALVPGDDRHLARYRASIVPWLWFLTRTADCRIFQEMTVPDIIKEVFGLYGFTDVNDYLEGEYRTWEYCVQYRETAFNFVNRLMEQEGIYYYFEHDNGKHMLALADGAGAHIPCPHYEQLRYMSGDSPAAVDYEHVSDWIIEQQVQPGEFAMTDYDYVDPGKSLLATKKAKRDHAMAAFPVFDYPGEYDDPGDGETYAEIRLDEFQAQHEVAMGESDARGIRCGYVFELTDHPRQDQRREYLVTSTVMDADLGEYDSAGGGEEAELFSCRFTAIDLKQQYRPPRVTPKPVVQGPQTAMVVGKSGEEIWTEEHGCVKVHFYWDRYGTLDENSSCFIRVSQVWAGAGWGAMFIPRIGHEVIVEFLEGDPDRPIITGRVYNGDNEVPYGLPGEATKSTIKSNSSKGGGGFNEIRFEDKKGEEGLFINGQKNQTINIGNDRTDTVGNDSTTDITNNETINVGVDRKISVGSNVTVDIGSNQTTTIGSKEEHTVGSDRKKTVGGNETIIVGANFKESVSGNRTSEVGATESVKADKITLEGSSKIELKVGGSTIVMESGEIRIKSATVKVEGGDGKVHATGGGVTINGSAINSEASGNHVIKGASVKIN